MDIRIKAQTAIRVWRNFGLGEVLRIPFRKIVAQKHLKLAGTDPVASFHNLVSFTVPSLEFLTACGRFQESAEKIDSYEEYLRLFNLRTHKPRHGFFGEIYDLGAGLGFVLFVLIEAEKPRLVIETGIAAGASSNLILNRLNAIESGELISVDITSKVGELVEQKLKNRWNVKVLPKLFKRKAFLHILNSNQNATIFLHDSDHSLQWQIFEISSAIKCLPSVKHILVDDVSEEFQSFVLNDLPGWNLVVIDEGRKFSGYLSRK